MELVGQRSIVHAFFMCRPTSLRLARAERSRLVGIVAVPPQFRLTPLARQQAIIWCGRSFQLTGMPVLITNCSNNYGPYQHPEKLIPLMNHPRRWRESRCRSMATALTFATGSTSRTIAVALTERDRTGASIGDTLQYRRRQRTEQPRPVGLICDSAGPRRFRRTVKA